MPETVGKIPEFTGSETLDQGAQPEVKPQEETTPSESSTEETSGETEQVSTEDTKVDDNQEVLTQKTEIEQALESLRQEKSNILEDIKNLRAERRGLKDLTGETAQQQPITQTQIDELKDLHQDDVAVIERVLKAKGYLSKEQFEQKLYSDIKQEELNKFLDKYPEYKPENDPNDTKWNTFQNTLKMYVMPKNPRDLVKILEKAHKDITPSVSDRTLATQEQKRRIETASLGSGGKGNVQRSSSLESFNSDKVYALRSGGFSDEEILKILNKTEG